MIKKLLISMLLCVSAASAYAKTTTIKAGNDEINPWTIATKNDGYSQILGLYDNKKFIVQVSPLHNGQLSDSITIYCNAGNGSYERHEVASGATITCYPHLSDIISMYIEPETFKNGAEGIFKYEAYTPTKTN